MKWAESVLPFPTPFAPQIEKKEKSLSQIASLEKKTKSRGRNRKTANRDSAITEKICKFSSSLPHYTHHNNAQNVRVTTPNSIPLLHLRFGSPYCRRDRKEDRRRCDAVLPGVILIPLLFSLCEIHTPEEKCVLLLLEHLRHLVLKQQ